jgi:hypothetical protein
VVFIPIRKEKTMYGTVARLRVKPGMEDQFRAFGEEASPNPPPGHVAFYVYQMDTDPNAASPEQDAAYRKLREVLAADPEWHDGAIIATDQAG